MKQHKGFTLIEMLVALSIFSAVMGLALLAFEQGRLNWTRSLHSGESESRVLYREQWLRLAFEQSVAARFRSGSSQSSPFFYGDNENMRFLSSAPIFQGPGKVAAIELQIKRVDEQWQLRYREKLGADPQRGLYMAEVDWFPLLTNLKSIEFSYEGDIHAPFNDSISSIPQGKQAYYRDQPAWLSKFESEYEESIPRRVKIRFIDQNSQIFEWVFTLNHHSNVLEPAYTPGTSS
ncbi:prepilin-type N-terminal cleavage/methylation domain-containing protein [Motilimonas sp. 1_MG-2023]|uniref:PulJ/GspJ family protein n=1 Tax=Motilimonas sp. 1_MG-2023 TaxID=3062672 RepID=UPI0026E214CA|nr:prepilin-type N-terminal cleavage/methylation domain-containing protein [Motilimonas sp. 1_MG-2023]MDO6527420.1 prepilin-type N-terminal cleavage/methylation domain-containing protein [Motilimonas sp. 1_MG-2023]